MIRLKDLKVGDYVKCLYNDDVVIVDKINKKSFTTTRNVTIYESAFKYYFVITEEEVRAIAIHNYSKELKELNKNLKELNKHLKELQKDLDTVSLYNSCYIDTQAIEDKIDDILENIKEELENEN